MSRYSVVLGMKEIIYRRFKVSGCNICYVENH